MRDTVQTSGNQAPISFAAQSTSSSQFQGKQARILVPYGFSLFCSCSLFLPSLLPTTGQYWFPLKGELYSPIFVDYPEEVFLGDEGFPACNRLSNSRDRASI